MSIRRPQTPEEQAHRKAQYAKSYAKRKARVAASHCRGAVCTVTRGRHFRCHGVIRSTVDRVGRVTAYCERCERRQSGVCRDCPRPVYGKVGWAVYCVGCKRRVAADQNRKWVRHNRSRKNASVRRWARANPEKVGAYEKRRYWAKVKRRANQQREGESNGM